jgi:hypothetical protein
VINPAVFTTTFLAAAVEIIEMVIIVVGVGAVRGWRSTLLGTGAGLAVVAALIVALGTALTTVPVNVLRVVAGSLLFVFGLQWLRKGIRRVGDDWTVAAAVAAALAVTWLLHTAGVAAWWLPPLVAVAATGASLRRIKR